MAVACKESGVWLHAIPIAAVGTKLDNDSLRIAVGLRLGVDICSPHQCICGSPISSSGTHGLSCAKTSGRYSRHEEINSIVHRGLNSAGIPSILEPTGTSRNDGKRPDGMTLFPLKNGKAMVWDATCVDPLAKSNLNLSALRPGSASAHAEKQKCLKYSNLGKCIFF